MWFVLDQVINYPTLFAHTNHYNCIQIVKAHIIHILLTILVFFDLANAISQIKNGESCVSAMSLHLGN